jgi:hypothetical protein
LGGIYITIPTPPFEKGKLGGIYITIATLPYLKMSALLASEQYPWGKIIR